MFEFDPAKGEANKAKHGIDFIDAQALWSDEHRIEAGVIIRGGEERQLVVGNIDGKLWTAVLTRRGDALRLISVRRARERETEEYHRGRV